MDTPNPFPMHVGIVVTSAAQLAAVYALLGGASSVAVAAAAPSPTPAPTDAAPTPAVEQSETAAEASPPATGEAELDAHGHPWNPDLHASTKGQTKEGLWRLKPGASRPDPMPGYPKEETPTESPTPSPASPAADGATEPAGSSQTQEPASAAASPEDEDDEFAAFREAAAESNAQDAAAAASVPARSWTDADLSKLCNQAAQKLGNPQPVKDLIAEHVPEGAVAHSRNIPEDKREAFAQAVEAKAEIEYVG